MAFNSLHFLLFFPMVCMGYFCLPQRYRWILLLVASYYFYMSWKAEYVILIMVSTLIDYIAALGIAGAASDRRRKWFLWFSLAANLGFLFLFKYFNFVSDAVRDVLGQFSMTVELPYMNVLLPVGISFYTFQKLSYTIDVYNRKIEPQRHLGIFAVYVAFFPQLVAGPIERARNLLPQFLEKHVPRAQRIYDGLRIMLWGFFLKIVLADRLSIFVDMIYDDPVRYAGLPLWIGTYFFSYQIYCDFAGYSFIAIGAAQVLGFSLMENFRRPYFSPSVSEFWRRWHISLSTWLRDYLFIPIGGSRVVRWRHLLNLLFVFLVCGLWHGAGWTFVVWGLILASYLILSIMTKPVRETLVTALGLSAFPRLHHVIRVAITFHLMAFAWIFFRANTLGDAFYVITHLFSGGGSISQTVQDNFGGDTAQLAIAIGAIGFLETVHFFQENKPDWQVYFQRNQWIRWAASYGMIFCILLFGSFRKVPFIYFQF